MKRNAWSNKFKKSEKSNKPAYGKQEKGNNKDKNRMKKLEQWLSNSALWSHERLIRGVGRVSIEWDSGKLPSFPYNSPLL